MKFQEESYYYFETNRNRFFDLMPENSFALFFAATEKFRSGDTTYPYCQDKNFYFLTGLNLTKMALVLEKKREQNKAVLFSKEISTKLAHWIGERPSLTDLEKDCRLQVKSIDELNSHCYRALSACNIGFFDYETIIPPEPTSFILQFINSIKERLPHVQIKQTYELIAQLRQLKQPWEIQRIKNAIDLTREGILQIIRNAKIGMKEYELEAYFNFSLNLKHTVPAFPTIIATGKNATILHYTSNNSSLSPNDLVLLDLGAEFQHYSADISRTFPITGKFTSQQRSLYEVVLEANKATINAVKPGVKFSDLNDIAQITIAAGLMKLKLIKDQSEVTKYFTHPVSHMLGLDTHDSSLDHHAPLQPGMVITVEPGIYIPELSVGIRIEDDILVTNTGHENLSESIPKELDEIEALFPK